MYNAKQLLKDKNESAREKCYINTGCEVSEKVILEPVSWGIPKTLTLGCVPIWGHPTWVQAIKNGWKSVFFQWLVMKNRLPREGIFPVLADPKSDWPEWGKCPLQFHFRNIVFVL
jgi:hypothetical protein